MMNREIKFRLHDKQGIIIGYEIHKKNEFDCWQIYQKSLRGDWINDDGEKLVREGYFIAATHKVQFTGLKDKNYKYIYEGDILENDNGVKYVVIWTEQLGGFYLSNPNSQRWKEIISCAASKVANEPMLLIKESVIGNIYETPELINS